MYGSHEQLPWGRLASHPITLALLFFVSLIPSAIVGLGVFAAHKVQEHGRKATANIDYWHSHDDDQQELFHTDYHFRLDSRDYRPHWVHRALNVVVHKDTVPGSVWPEHIEVLYLPDDPSWNLPAKHENAPRFAILLSICLSVNFCLIAGAFISRAYWRRHDELFQHLADADP